MTLDEERQHIMSVIAQLERRIDGHSDKLDSLRTVPATLEAIDRRLWVSETALKDLGAKMDTTAAVTKSIHDAQLAGRAVNSVGKWVGGAIIGLAGVWAALKGFRFP